MSARLLFLGDSVAAESTFGFVPMVIRNVTQVISISSDSVNSSVPSSNVLDLLDRTQELLPLQTQPFTATCIFVGINDSKIFVNFDEALVPRHLFSRRLEMLAQRLEASGSSVVLCGLPDLDFARIEEGGNLKEFWYWIPEQYRAYNNDIKSVAEKVQTRRFVDLNAAFKSAADDVGQLYGPDGVHPSAQGHAVIADAITPALTDRLRS